MKKKLYLNFLFTGNSLVFEVKCTGIFLEFSSTFSKILFLFSNFAHFAHSLVLHWGHEIILYLVALTLSNCALSDEWWWLYNQVSDMMLPLFHHSSDPPSLNFDYLLWRGGESEKFKKVGGIMVQGQVFLKGDCDTFLI